MHKKWLKIAIENVKKVREEAKKHKRMSGNAYILLQKDLTQIIAYLEDLKTSNYFD